MGEEIRAKTNIFHHHFVEEQKVWFFFTLDTLLKTNIAPENGLMVDYFHFGEKGLFWGTKIWVSGRARWKIQTKLASHLDFVIDGCLAKVGKRPWKGHGIIMHTTDNAGHRGPFCRWCHYLINIYIYTYRLPKASKFLGWLLNNHLFMFGFGPWIPPKKNRSSERFLPKFTKPKPVDS